MHTNPDVLALLALGENPASASEHHHLLNCAYCQAELADLRHVTALARSGALEGRLEEPPERVWLDIRRALDEAATSDAAGSGQGPGPTAAARRDVTRNGRRDPQPVGSSPVGSSPVEPRPLESRPLEPSSLESSPVESRPARSRPVEPRTDGEPLAGVTPLPDRTSEASPGPSRRAGRGRRVLSLALAAGLALIAGVGIGVAWDRSRTPGEIVAVADLQALPGWSGAAGTAVVRQDSDGTRTLVVTLDTPQPVDGNVQVWLLTPDAAGMQPVGFINGERGFWAIPNGLDLERFPVVDVSDEPRNDTDSAHSGNSIVRGRIAT